jgi:hypothetical protein
LVEDKSAGIEGFDIGNKGLGITIDETICRCHMEEEFVTDEFRYFLVGV